MSKQIKIIESNLNFAPKTVRELLVFALKPYWKKSAIFLFLTFLGVLCWNSSTYAASELINNLSKNQTVTSSAWIIVAFFGVFRIFDEIFWRLGEILMRSYKPELIERIRSMLFSTTLKKQHSYFVNSSSGRISYWVNQTTNSVDLVMNNTIWGTWGEFLGLVLSTVFLFTTHWSLAVLFATWLILLFTYNAKRGKKLSKLVAKQSDETSKASSIVVDSVSNSINVRVFNARQHEKQVLLAQQKNIIRSWKKTWKFSIITNTVKGQSSGLVNVIAICLAVWLFSKGVIEVGGLALFLAYFNAASSGLWNLAYYLDEYYRQFGTIQNALDGLNAVNERSNDDKYLDIIPEKVAISIKDLSFAYPEAIDDLVVKNLNLEILEGQKVGIVGHSGAGKSTLIGLLLGFYEPVSGNIFVNGIDAYEKDPSFIRSISAYVPQDTSMFNRTIRDNIVYSKPSASDTEIIGALTKANALDFVQKLPQGLDTLVGERGVKLSGGQRQRIAIARAILKDAPLLLLDEATSALDSVSEQAIQKALHELMKGRTAVVIAHRLSTLKHLDKIVVIEKGEIAEVGSHDQLLDIKDGIYADLWKRQKDGFIVE
ncbi:MAG: ABC transporter ATP-binding protein [Candidatus Saccharibacteria bacterium]|nr:ABC transporter ATP-binding protein [Candidatus Saccharibacteria bacterium]